VIAKEILLYTSIIAVKRRVRRCVAVVLALTGLASCGLPAVRAAATMTVRLSLAQVVSSADRAFVGRVVSVDSGRDAAGVPSTRVTFAVSEAINGNVGSEVTIKQFGVSEPLPDGTIFHPAGVPAYRVGEEMVLFLSGQSAAGFCSPIGLGQGKFDIVRRDGHAFVTATIENAGTLRPLQRRRGSATTQPIEAELDQFLNLVHRLATENR